MPVKFTEEAKAGSCPESGGSIPVITIPSPLLPALWEILGSTQPAKEDSEAQHPCAAEVFLSQGGILFFRLCSCWTPGDYEVTSILSHSGSCLNE